jgi:hypothetical protein
VRGDACSDLVCCGGGVARPEILHGEGCSGDSRISEWKIRGSGMLESTLCQWL